MDRVRSQVSPADVARLRRLGEMMIFIADLPESGAHVLVGSLKAQFELCDLILQHRGTAVLESTNVHRCCSADMERAAVCGEEPELIYLAPGYTAHWVIARGGQPKPAKVISTGPAGLRALGALLPLGHRVEVASRAEVPGALRHAWPSSPESLPPVPARGPWHRPVVA